MSPTTPPIIINMPATSAAPWWAPYVLAGLFVVAGAAIGMISTGLSDRRKHRADDRRQWDKEIRDLYLHATKCFEAVRSTRWTSDDRTGPNVRYETASQAEAELRTIVDSLELIADQRTLQAARDLLDGVGGVTSLLHDRITDKERYRALYGQHNELLAAVKSNLRTASSKPITPRSARS
jgi:hypothetical protein